MCVSSKQIDYLNSISYEKKHLPRADAFFITWRLDEHQ